LNVVADDGDELPAEKYFEVAMLERVQCGREFLSDEFTKVRFQP
jgi:hypothetical protein